MGSREPAGRPSVEDLTRAELDAIQAAGDDAVAVRGLAEMAVTVVSDDPSPVFNQPDWVGSHDPYVALLDLAGGSAIEGDERGWKETVTAAAERLHGVDGSRAAEDAALQALTATRGLINTALDPNCTQEQLHLATTSAYETSRDLVASTITLGRERWRTAERYGVAPPAAQAPVIDGQRIDATPVSPDQLRLLKEARGSDRSTAPPKDTGRAVSDRWER